MVEIGGVIVILEEAQDGHVGQGVGGGVEVVRNWKVLSFVVNRVQVLCNAVSKPPLGLTDVAEATLEEADAIDHISGCAGDTPLGSYKKLIEYYKNGDLSFRYVKTFNMDEYV
eukprot:g23518.t1